MRALRPRILKGVRFALFLALAHLRRRPLQTALALGGVGVGVAVLLAALSLANGFTSGLVRATLKATLTWSSFAWGRGFPLCLPILR